MTTVCFKSYVRRDGTTMLYINGSNKCSIGISPESDFRPYGQGSTQGKRNLYSAACRIIRHQPEFTGNLDDHKEEGFCAVVNLANGWAIAGTDVAEVGGMKVPSDGGYLVANGHIVPLGEWLDEEDDEE